MVSMNPCPVCGAHMSGHKMQHICRKQYMTRFSHPYQAWHSTMKFYADEPCHAAELFVSQQDESNFRPTEERTVNVDVKEYEPDDEDKLGHFDTVAVRVSVQVHYRGRIVL